MTTREQWVAVKTYAHDHATGNVDQLVRYLEPHVLMGYVPPCLGNTDCIEFGEKEGPHDVISHEPNRVVFNSMDEANTFREMYSTTAATFKLELG